MIIVVAGISSPLTCRKAIREVGFGVLRWSVLEVSYSDLKLYES